MADWTVVVLLLAAFCGVLTIGAHLPGRLLDWIDHHVLEPAIDDLDEETTP